MTEWSSFWARIGDKTPDSSFADSDTLWILVEKAINTMNKSLLLSVDPSHRPESLRFVFDNDKVHCGRGEFGNNKEGKAWCLQL